MDETLGYNLSQMLSDLRFGILKMTKIVMDNFNEFEGIIKKYDQMTQEIREEQISKIKANDLSVHSLGDALESEAVKILSMQSPFSRALRTVVSSFRMIYDIQRISRDTSHSFVGLTSFIKKQTESFDQQHDLFLNSLTAAKDMINLF